MDFPYLCRQVLKSHNRVLGTWVIRKATLIEHATRKGVPLPKPTELNKMFLQASMMISETSTNEVFYGKMESIVVNHEKLSGILVPLDDEHFLAVGCARPCDPRSIIANIDKVIAEAKP